MNTDPLPPKMIDVAFSVGVPQTAMADDALLFVEAIIEGISYPVATAVRPQPDPVMFALTAPAGRKATISAHVEAKGQRSSVARRSFVVGQSATTTETVSSPPPPTPTFGSGIAASPSSASGCAVRPLEVSAVSTSEDDQSEPASAASGAALAPSEASKSPDWATEATDATQDVQEP